MFPTQSSRITIIANKGKTGRFNRPVLDWQAKRPSHSRCALFAVPSSKRHRCVQGRPLRVHGRHAFMAVTRSKGVDPIE
ncbi:MAG: hypothetical protein KM312_10750, partial [Hydrogenibacillus schlegelii]|nr:hypothetical protein [Hydrogenibacillus schlegelii]